MRGLPGKSHLQFIQEKIEGAEVFGTDFYTVSKMFGHKSIKTTQVYAKVIDKKKQEAAGKIWLDLECLCHSKSNNYIASYNYPFLLWPHF